MEITGLILYFDLLGYKSMVLSNDVELNDVVMNRIKNFTSGRYLYDLKLQNINKKINIEDCFFRAFSDNFIFVYKSNKTDKELIDFVGMTRLILNQFFGNGFIVRGSISYGTIYYDDKFVFGKDLVNAVLLESKEKYPTINLSDEILEQFNRIQEENDIDFLTNGKLKFMNWWFNTELDAEMYEGYFNKYLYYLNKQVSYISALPKYDEEVSKILDKINYLTNEYNNHFTKGRKLKIIFNDHFFEIIYI